MNIWLIIIVSIMIVLWVIIRNKSQKEINGKDKEIEQKENDIQKNINEMEELFYKNVRNGEKPYKIMNIINQFDLMFIKSLFHSEQIP